MDAPYDTSKSLAWRGLAALGAMLVLALLLSAVVLWRGAKETGQTNSYALVAQSLMTGRPDVPRCYDGDCAVRGGRTYVVFPPFPAVVAMPLVAAFGVETKGFIAIAVACFALSLLLWHRILRTLEVAPVHRLAVLAAIGFSSPLYYVTWRADGIWFFAQALAFVFVTLAIHETLSERLVTAGLALAAALLCRQLSIFYAPILLLLALPPETRLLRVGRSHLAIALKVGIPVAIGIAAYLAYNAWRFGNPLDTGYRDIAFPAGLMRSRVEAHGIWSLAYLPFNLVYLLLQGFHATFAEPQRVLLTGLDDAGTGVLAASPWLLYLFRAPLRREVLGCLALILGFSAVLLFYHSNGFLQYNVQRYALDWFPAALLVLAAALGRSEGEMFRPLVLWGMALNLATVVVLALVRAG